MKCLQPILNVFPVIVIPSKLWELQFPTLLPPLRQKFFPFKKNTLLSSAWGDASPRTFPQRGLFLLCYERDVFDFSSDNSCNDWNTDSIVPWKSRNRASLLSKMSNGWRFLQCLMRWSPQSSRWMDAGGYLVRLFFLQLWRGRAIWLDNGHLQFQVYS